MAEEKTKPSESGKVLTETPPVISQIERDSELKAAERKPAPPRATALTAASVARVTNATLADVLKNAPKNGVIVVRNNQDRLLAEKERGDCEVRVREDLAVDALWRNPSR